MITGMTGSDEHRGTAHRSHGTSGAPRTARAANPGGYEALTRLRAAAGRGEGRHYEFSATMQRVGAD
jgi:hypothetical protein